MKNKIRTTSFWLGISGAIVIILDTLADIFGVNFYSKEVETIILSICSVLVMIGFITKRNANDKQDVANEELLDDFKKDK